MVLLGTQWGWRCRCVYEHSFHLFHLLGLHSLGKQAEVVWVSQNKSNARLELLLDLSSIGCRVLVNKNGYHADKREEIVKIHGYFTI